MPEYTLTLVSFLIVGVVLHWQTKVRLYASKKHLAVFLGLCLVIGILWDTWAITRGHWAFGEQFIVGTKVGVLPIEEFGFMLIMPYFFLVVYKSIEKYFSK